MIEKGFAGWRLLGILYRALGVAVHSHSASFFRTVEYIAEFSQIFLEISITLQKLRGTQDCSSLFVADELKRMTRIGMEIFINFI